MIGRLEAFVRRVRRSLSRSEWMARLLRLTLSSGTGSAAGLVMIQIDGLSYRELKRAFGRGELPFLRQLIERQHYRLHKHYSGVPSSTAAVQGELFYGAPGAVAGFNFLDHESGELVRMFEPTTAARIERRLAEQAGEPLLKGGSCYVDNFTGGADEPHFCPAARDWGPGLREAGPTARAVFLIVHILSFLRTTALLLIELVLALVDCVRGLIAGQDLWKELKFVPTRVAIVVLLREMATIGATIDAARGLPTIHVNFLGYDEQAHRRGPASRFAHWTLKGIDGAIGRIWRSAHRSARRHYDVWIYSDHGQEHVLSYEKVHGRPFAEAVAEVFACELGHAVDFRSSGSRGAHRQRAGCLGAERGDMRSPRDEGGSGGAPLLIAPLGPVAMIYYEGTLSVLEEHAIASGLARRAAVPLLLAKEGADAARAWTEAGEFELPRDAARILGGDHPFLVETARDLVALCHHPDAGRLIACGWRSGIPALTFTVENGAHGGISPAETCAFALLPDDAPLGDRDYLRPRDLRQAALHVLGRAGEEARPARSRRRAEAQSGTVRVMTYNVHSCIGMDGRLAPERIARMIARYDADVIALQELDVSRLRTGGVDQAHLIAHYLEMDFHFHPTLHLEEERYGDAILTHLPMRLVQAGALPGLPSLEPRGAIWVAVDVGGFELNVINTHLGLTSLERRMQADALLGPRWLGHPDAAGPVVLCGDFNALPSSTVCRRLRGRLKDAQLDYARRRPQGTFFGRLPMVRIDHVFISGELEVIDVEVPSSALARVASDHLPLIVELKARHSYPSEGGRLHGKV